MLVALQPDPPDEATLARERALILQESDSRKRADLLACAVTIGSRYFAREFLWRFFKEEVEMLREASFIEDWLQEKLDEGLEKGLQQGEQRARLTDLRRILSRRFGVLPLSLLERLRGLSAEQLEPLLETALDAATLAEFQAAVPPTDLVPSPLPIAR